MSITISSDSYQVDPFVKIHLGTELQTTPGQYALTTQLAGNAITINHLDLQERLDSLTLDTNTHRSNHHLLKYFKRTEIKNVHEVKVGRVQDKITSNILKSPYSYARLTGGSLDISYHDHMLTAVSHNVATRMDKMKVDDLSPNDKMDYLLAFAAETMFTEFSIYNHNIMSTLLACDSTLYTDTPAAEARKNIIDLTVAGTMTAIFGTATPAANIENIKALSEYIRKTTKKKGKLVMFCSDEFKEQLMLEYNETNATNQALRDSNIYDRKTTSSAFDFDEVPNEIYNIELEEVHPCKPSRTKDMTVTNAANNTLYAQDSDITSVYLPFTTTVETVYLAFKEDLVGDRSPFLFGMGPGVLETQYVHSEREMFEYQYRTSRITACLMPGRFMKVNFAKTHDYNLTTTEVLPTT